MFLSEVSGSSNFNLHIRRPRISSSTTMNEMNFQSICNSFNHYRTLDEQTALLRIKEGLPSRRTLSTTRPTYVQFPVQLERHWAAVQITVTPFILRKIPGQTFYTSSYRYTLCCDLANPSPICQIVQRTYDVDYHPIQWDFSNKNW